ncbi:bifunctional glycosyltransferase/CDP-glycerol:glycerophosphate glycerophosphotransferase [Arthrobacter rhombi]|uniref:bifunctional glycosyltransferase/CDP-glycerol:glycerophosphate glycerophosphotransferase n=1 Tax=Arthrobacter rhombi TaxID=71253 RepID=UPI003FD5E017
MNLTRNDQSNLDVKGTPSAYGSEEHGGFSLVVAMYNIARFLPDFFESLEKQKYPFDALDIVLVDDGSTDSTHEVARTWAGEKTNVTVLSKANGGQASARNLGLDSACNEWVCFVDPDDMLDEQYFAESYLFMTEETHLAAPLYATNPIYLEETTGKIRDGHPLRGRFRGGNRLVDLRGYPNSIQMQATTAFFRRSVLSKYGIEFGTSIRPTFEDAHFTSHYLLRCAEPVIGIISTARYIYRKRADGTSTLQTSHGDARKYTDVPRYGLLDILKKAIEIQGPVPVWLQNVILYDLFWLFKSDRSIYSTSAGLSDAVFEEFHELTAEIMDFIDEESVMSFDAMPISLWMRQALAWGYQKDHRTTNYALVRGLDSDQNLVKVVYRYTGDLPDEQLRVRGQVVRARHAKIQSHDFYRRTMLRERTLWVSAAGTMRLMLNGKDVDFLSSEPNRPTTVILPNRLAAMRKAIDRAVPIRFRQKVQSRPRYFLHWAREQQRAIAKVSSKSNLQDICTGWMLRSPKIRTRYAKAWVFMDRDNEANDSAEEMYHWLRANRPEVNAWYVLRKSTPDWDRLEAMGVKLVEYGSLQWKLLLLSADHLASSHIDDYVVKPLDVKRYGPRRWKFTFLQHGIIKGDLSRWLNHKSVDLFVTSTKAEYDSIAGNDSPYRFSTKEVRLTGLPRHDALIRKSALVSRRRYILVAPTWRSYLVPKNRADSAERDLNAEFSSSEYVSSYKGLLHSPELRRLAKEAGLQIAFMPHPNTQPYMDAFDVPAWVEVKRYGESDVQEVMAETSVMITDYSSIAFNIAYLNGAVVYFQFDREDYFGGGHTERPSYYDYELDGFGPVVETLSEATDAVSNTISHGGVSKEYQERIDSTFPVRDGNNARRVYSAMLDLRRNLSFEDATVAFTKENWASLGAGEDAVSKPRVDQLPSAKAEIVTAESEQQ